MGWLREPDKKSNWQKNPAMYADSAFSFRAPSSKFEFFFAVIVVLPLIFTFFESKLVSNYINFTSKLATHSR